MEASQHKIVGEHLYDGVVFHGPIRSETLDKLKQIVFDDQDVIVMSYPKSGTTVLQEIVYLVQSEGNFESSNEIPIQHRFPYLEIIYQGVSFLEEALKMSPPRLLKSHLTPNYFKETLEKSKTKFVIVMRNPKDVLVSYYHFYRMNEQFNLFPGTWDEFFTIFQENRLLYGSYFDSVGSWWEFRDNPNLLIVKYEDIVDDPSTVVRQVASHLGKDLSDELVAKIVERTRFKNMKNIPTLHYAGVSVFHHDISPFMRKGEIGDWQNYFNDEQNNIVDELYKTHCEDKGLVFKFGNEII